ncbi:MAG: hypothetical protein IIB33_01770 [Chloroflexi bacterium]|nr:hypothetical protein [Chloroflexota bacterium]
MVIQEASRNDTLDGVVVSRYCPASDYSIMFVGMSSSDADFGDSIIHNAVNGGRLLLLTLENMMFASLSELAFAEDWGSEADRIYDNF